MNDCVRPLGRSRYSPRCIVGVTEKLPLHILVNFLGSLEWQNKYRRRDHGFWYDGLFRCMYVFVVHLVP